MMTDCDGACEPGCLPELAVGCCPDDSDSRGRVVAESDESDEDNADIDADDADDSPDGAADADSVGTGVASVDVLVGVATTSSRAGAVMASRLSTCMNAAGERWSHVEVG